MATATAAPIKELEDLFSLISQPEDRAALEEILNRNEAVTDRLASSQDLYRAFVDEDPAAAARVESGRASSQPGSSSRAQPGIDLSRVDKLVADRVTAILEDRFKAPTFAEQIQQIVDKRANELTPGLITQTTRISDEIFTIRSSHRDEFGEPLDTTAFTGFIDQQKAKGKTYASYVDAHNDFVQEKRIEKRIADGIAAGRQARPVSPVPGTTLGSGNSVLDSMIKANKLTAAESARGPALDNAARALRNLQASRVE